MFLAGISLFVVTQETQTSGIVCSVAVFAPRGEQVLSFCDVTRAAHAFTVEFPLGMWAFCDSFDNMCTVSILSLVTIDFGLIVHVNE